MMYRLSAFTIFFVIGLYTLLLAIGLIERVNAQSGVYAGGQNFVIYTAATNNAQMIGIPGPHQVTGVTTFSTAASDMFVRIYDSASPPTCSSGVGLVAAFPMPKGATLSAFNSGLDNGGFTVQNGIGLCVTGAIGAADNTAGAVGGALSVTIR